MYDNIHRDGRLSHRAYTYNQGTFIGAANFLGYTNEAMLATSYAMERMCNDGLLPAYGEDGDAAGFNGICVRWIAKFMNDHRLQAHFEPWLQKNADAAWSVRRSPDNISWNDWYDPTPPGIRSAWGSSSSVVILQVVRPMGAVKAKEAR